MSTFLIGFMLGAGLGLFGGISLALSMWPGTSGHDVSSNPWGRGTP